jgi:tRNA-splicing ligase RtcB
MIVHFGAAGQHVPVKIWLANSSDLEPGCAEQAEHLASLPFVFKHVALMPDTHQGYGMPIGGVLATRDVIIPHAIGVDIGCGMSYLQTDIPVKFLKEQKTGSGTLVQDIVGNILRTIPTGFGHRPEAMTLPDDIRTPLTLKTNETEAELNNAVFPSIFKQVGTLGGGNHFIELQQDRNGLLAIMIHSGSRNVGKQVCDFFNKKAVELNKQMYSSVPPEWSLAFLPVQSELGQRYISWMNFALDFAKYNRKVMLDQVWTIVFGTMRKHGLYAPDINILTGFDVHHNYAALENHFGSNVWVHRKGAISARKGEKGIIPGSMATPSYIVEGLGNPESFNSASHGAGRAMSRKKALESIKVDDVMQDLKDKDIVLAKHNKKDVAEECGAAYKDILTVMDNEADLVKKINRLTPIAVVKG